MLYIKKDMLLFDNGIKDRLDFIVKYTNNVATFENENVISIEKTNLYYVEPHRMTQKDADRLKEMCELSGLKESEVFLICLTGLKII